MGVHWTTNTPQLPGAPDGHFDLAVQFYTDTPWPEGKFKVVCDRPCDPVAIRDTHGLGVGKPFATTDDGKGAIFDFGNIFISGAKPVFPSLTPFILEVEGKDTQLVKVLDVKPVTAQGVEKK